MGRVWGETGYERRYPVIEIWEMVAWYPPSGLGGNDLIQTSTWLVGAAPVIGMVVVRSATRTVASSRVLSSPPGVADADDVAHRSPSVD